MFAAGAAAVRPSVVGGFFLGEDVETVGDVEHGVVAHGVRPGFGASLRVDRVLHVADLAEYVHGVEFQRQLAVEQGLAERGVPHPVRRVERRVAVSASAVQGHVGAYLPLLGQVEQYVGARRDVEGGDVVEIGALRAAAQPGQAALETEGVFVDAVGQAEPFAEPQVVHDAARQFLGVGGVVHRVDEGAGRARLELEGLVAAEGQRELHRGVGVPVAVDVLGHPGADTRLSVVVARLGHGAVGVAEVGVDGQVAVRGLPEAGELQAGVVGGGPAQARVVDVDVGRVAVVDRAELVVEARHRLAVAVGQGQAGGRLGVLVAVFQFDGGLQRARPARHGRVEAVALVVETFAAQVLRQVERYGVVPQKVTLFGQELVVQLHARRIVVLGQRGVIGIVEVEGQPGGVDRRGQDDALARRGVGQAFL